MLLPIADTRDVRRTALRLMRDHRLDLALVLGLHTLAALAGLVGPLLIGAVLDSIVAGTATRESVAAAAAWLLASVVVQAIVTRFAQLRSMVLGENVFARLREELLAAVGRLPLATVERAGTGDLLSRTTNDVESIAQTVRFGVPRVLVALVTVVLTAAAALLTNPLLALAVFVGVPLLVGGARWYLGRAAKGYQRQLASFAVLSGTVTETVEAARTVEALGLAPVRRAEVDAAIQERRDSELYTLGLRTVFFPITNLGFLLPVVAVVAWGSYLVSAGLTTVGEVTAVALIATQLTRPLEELIIWMDELQVGTTALSRIIGVSQVPSDRTPSGETPVDEHLAAEDVHYSYRSGIEVLHGIDLDLRVGERLAIVGPTGSGKSTFARLLNGLVVPTEGTVSVDGMDTRTRAREVRRRVGFVFQDPDDQLFMPTVAEDVAFGPANLGLRGAELEQRVMTALDQVGMALYADRPPHHLSFGQRRRVAVATVLSMHPEILVLDEPVSALDMSVQAQVINLLKDLQNRLGLSYLFIAHDLSVVRHISDRVAVMRHGEVVETGDRDDLFENPQHPYTRELLQSVPNPDPWARADAPARRLAVV